MQQSQKKNWWKRGRAWILLSIALLCAVLFRSLLWNLLSQVLLGVGMASALSPVCKLLERKTSRSVAAIGSLIALVLVLGLLVTLLLPPFIQQMQLLASQIPMLIGQLNALLDRAVALVSDMGMPNLLDENVYQRVGEFSGVAINAIAQQATGIVAALGRIGLAAVLAFYFLRDREIFLQRLTMMVPLAHRRRALLAAAEMRREVGGYLRGQAVVSLCIGLLTAVGLLIINMPAWLALGVWMAVFDLVPYFGPFLGAIPVLLFSLSGGWGRILWAMGVVIFAQQIENNFISPRVLGQSTGLHPVVVILALSAGGALMGIWGMLCALPVVVAARGALRVLRYHEEHA